VHPYDSRGSVWFEVASDDIRFREATGERKLKLSDSVHVSKLTALLRENKIFLVSTPRSRFSEARTRKGPISSAAIRMADTQHQNRHLSHLDTPSGRYLPGLVMRQGDGISLQLSRDVADQVGLIEGARVEIEPTDDGRLIITRSRRHFTLDELLAGMTPEREPPLEDDGPRGEEVI
jgi:antitoxin component of MazEF toxin-antitoxin module